MTRGTLTLLHGDALARLQTLPGDSVHCMVTSPPYYGVRDYKAAGQIGLESTVEEFVAKLVAVFREARRVLHPMGSLWVNLGDSYAGSGLSGGTKLFEKNGSMSHRGALQKGRITAPGLKAKDLIGIPWRVALALQADGWYLRSDIIWAKKNPMPGSQRDRPTTAHEYVFLLTKTARYFYDEERISEPVSGTANARGNGVNPKAKTPGKNSRFYQDRDPSHSSARKVKQNESFSATVTGLVSRRKKRTVWSLATAPYKKAHFATFPPKLIEPCIQAGTSEMGCCPKCLAPWERITAKGEPDREWQRACGGDKLGGYNGTSRKDYGANGAQDASATKARILEGMVERVTIGWRKGCRCHYRTPIRCTVLDMFGGSGTTGEVALDHGCDAILIELAEHYLPLIRERCAEKPPVKSRKTRVPRCIRQTDLFESPASTSDLLHAEAAGEPQENHPQSPAETGQHTVSNPQP